jgi:uncharacterized protein YceK
MTRRACRVALPVLLLIAGCSSFSEPRVPDPGPKTTAYQPGAQDSASENGAVRPARQLDGSLHGRTGAHLTLGSAAAAVDLRLAALPGLLYRIRTPGDSGLAPRVIGRPGFVDLRLAPTGDDGPDRVHILLNRDVVWQIRMTAGAGEQHLDLTGGRFSGLVLGGSAGLVRLRLPRPTGTSRIRLIGPVGALEVVVAPRVPVRVRLAGAGTAARVPWPVRTPTREGAVLTAPAWPTATDRYVIDSRSTLGELTVSGR